MKDVTKAVVGANGKSDAAAVNVVNKMNDNSKPPILDGTATMTKNKADEVDVAMADKNNIGDKDKDNPKKDGVPPAAAENGTGGCTTKAPAGAAVPPVNADNSVGVSPAIVGERYDGPPVNTEIEVLWEITGEDGSVEVTWWKARIQASEYVGSERVAILLYDSHGGFDEEVVRVHFKSPTELVDISRKSDASGGVLEWRLYDADRPVEVITSGELGEGMLDVNSRTIYEAGVEALSTLPAAQQAEFASRYRSFADQITDSLNALAASKGDGYVITEADVHAMMSKISKTMRD